MFFFVQNIRMLIILLHTVVEKIMYFIFFVKCPYLQNEKKVYKERKECNGGVEAE